LEIQVFTLEADDRHTTTSFFDDTRDLLRDKLKPPDKIHLNAFLQRVDPIQQFQNIKELSDPGLFESKQTRRERKKTCKLALISAQKLRSSTSSYENATKITGQQQTIYFSRKDNQLPIIIDTGASFSVTPNLDDFLGPIRPCTTKELNGLNSSITVVGVGTVEWKVQDLFGAVRSIKTDAYYVPDAGVRLFSPQVYFQKHKRGSYTVDHEKTILELIDGTTLHFPYQDGSNLPMMLTAAHFKSQSKFVGLCFQDAEFLGKHDELSAFIKIADETNQNMTASQRGLLYWHQRLGHANMARIQVSLTEPKNQEEKGILTPKNKKSSSCAKPLCTACQLAKQTRRTSPATNTTLNNDIAGHLSQGDLTPGQRVSMDQYMSALHGRLPHTKGKEPKSKKYTGGTIFHDHAT
jgi:hypothetical protein